MWFLLCNEDAAKGREVAAGMGWEWEWSQIPEWGVRTLDCENELTDLIAARKSEEE